MAARAVARELGISSAYRLHINNGRAAGQEVDHLHLHLLGGTATQPLDLAGLRANGL